MSLLKFTSRILPAVQRPSTFFFRSFGAHTGAAVPVPGADMPTAEQKSTGRELEEIQDRKHNERRFNAGPQRGPFGTQANPAVVLSTAHERIVGCVGGGEYEHPNVWFILRAGKKHMCAACGQFFVLGHDDAGHAAGHAAAAHH